MMEQFARSFSLETFKAAKELKSRVCFTLLALIVCRIGTFVPLPGINPDVVSEMIRITTGGMLGVLDMFSGGALTRVTIFSLGIMPYISSSIIIQLLSTMMPYLKALRKEGELGKKKLNKYTRYLTVVLASLQALGAAFFIEKISGVEGGAIVINVWLFRISTLLTLMGSTLFIMWLGEQITSRGIGSGVSVIIYSGIIANLPIKLIHVFTVGREEGIYYIVPLVLVFSAAVFGYVVFFEKAQRKIPIQYPKRNVRDTMALPNHMPLKVNMAGVMPPIFAQALLVLPISVLSSAVTNEYAQMFMMNMRPGNPIYMLLFVALVVFFAFFYTNLMFNTDETAENLKKSQAYIPGIRPGAQTSEYLYFVITRLTVVGSLYLASICVVPQLVMANVNMSDFYFGGTSILIIVSVTIETLSQMQTHLFAYQYKGLISQAKRRMDR